MRLTKPTVTTLILNLLKARDDFMDYAQIRESTGQDQNHVSAACFHLRQHRAIDCIINPDGHVWWFALPSVEDNRYRVLDEIKDGVTRPRRRKCGTPAGIE